jgi:hypothetical protein
VSGGSADGGITGFVFGGNAMSEIAMGLGVVDVDVVAVVVELEVVVDDVVGFWGSG